MTSLDVSKLSIKEVYQLMIGAIVPRPIAWVSTISKDGKTNLAPFSFFTGVCSNPPSLLICPVDHPDGREKDTLRNIRETKEFVVNVTSEATADLVNQTSADYSSDVSEIEALKIETIPSVKVKSPRVKLSPIQLECELINVVDVGHGGKGSGHVVIGKIVYFHCNDGVYKNGELLLDEIKPISRLAGPHYGTVGKVFESPRPVIKNALKHGDF